MRQGHGNSHNAGPSPLQAVSLPQLGVCSYHNAGQIRYCNWAGGLQAQVMRLQRYNDLEQRSKVTWDVGGE